MNIHDIDIELPEHWQAFQYNEGWNTWEQVIPSAANEPRVVKAYTADQVRAAIEADRQRRGEPVAWLVRDDMLATWLFKWVEPEPGLWKYVKPLYAAPQPAEPRLDAPAQVGHTRFGYGVPWSTVIGAAQRYHAIENTPTKEQERMKKAAERLKAIQPAEPVKLECPKCGAERSKVPCAGELMNCHFRGEAQSAEPSKQSEVREYLQQTLRTAADEACRLIANSDTPTKFEGIFGHRAEPVAEVSQKISGEPGINGSVLYAGVNWIKAPPPFGTKLYTAPVVAQPSAEPPSSD